MLIAEAASDPNGRDLYTGYVVLLAILTLVGLGVSIVTSIIMVSSNKKQRREVTFGFEPVSMKEYQEARTQRDAEIRALIQTIKDHIDVNRQDHDGLHRKIGGVERGARQEFQQMLQKETDGRGRIHDQMNDVLTAVGELRGEVRSMNRKA